ncbi:MAG: NAD(P)-dependent oxidoreductase [Hoeflea sp.]|uniref:NAD(P)-dependent oxidoreductase n=1 Tax=Hoeflea sp. TaxID=1940281 RepID=UPI001E0299D9|nr:NAD(P)-dependent oxidoreductase [Hoeflea sp.]MBU4527329.1 NAD(P)-dependent oxidoreductase [Alphaproteobacteria bacterium]MBU4546888.1 NAD(P)-dependent oxidoreductase [Alphaproteobacteria bacterium]MBU4551600.1 NAD(P)-dependent oxidoreductase [Alphaproteobacteria bacterium]MBV1725605.1 NAD(P)-dependent oxidoreductase [Hoeflea sp.]MBV1759653.1 NAD(P)-dependent oxidoreductase [Hoeflea sp.]
MTVTETRDVRPNRLSDAAYADNFSDIHPPLTPHKALVEADRCYFCYDAPCMTACPTSIDIPMFIRKIQAGNAVGAAKTIFEQNILGGMCARVCPTETLCEEVCVREIAEGKPVKIGLLQRHATDTYMEREQPHPFTRAAPTGKKIAVIGAGPAGLSCAHKLASLGHDVTIYEAREKAGGLNEYGIAAYKTTNDFAQDEVSFILEIGGISIETGKALGRDVTLDQLAADFDAVFLGVGLPGVNALGLKGETAAGVIDAVDFIGVLRQAEDLSLLEVGRRIVVLGGGMTAIDAAIQSKLLGAEEVTIAYRRGQEHMNASLYEQELAQTHGVVIRHWLAPVSLHVSEGAVSAITLEKTRLDNTGKLAGTGELVTLEADQVFKAIGQTPDAGPLAGSVELEKGRIRVSDDRRTSHPKIWAGGDCVAGGEDLTVVSVEDGKIAAQSIHKALMA